MIPPSITASVSAASDAPRQRAQRGAGVDHRAGRIPTPFADDRYDIVAVMGRMAALITTRPDSGVGDEVMTTAAGRESGGTVGRLINRMGARNRNVVAIRAAHTIRKRLCSRHDCAKAAAPPSYATGLLNLRRPQDVLAAARRGRTVQTATFPKGEQGATDAHAAASSLKTSVAAEPANHPRRRKQLANELGPVREHGCRVGRTRQDPVPPGAPAPTPRPREHARPPQPRRDRRLYGKS